MRLRLVCIGADRLSINGDKDIELELQEFGYKAWGTVHYYFEVAIPNHDVFSVTAAIHRRSNRELWGYFVILRSANQRKSHGYFCS